KSKKSSHQPKAEDTNHEKLYLFHMDLCGPMRVASINGKRYILVIVDDYSRFTWVRFLRTKDESHEAIIKCIQNIQVRLNATVHNVRTDNGTKFVNQTLREFYENVGISHQTSIAHSSAERHCRKVTIDELTVMASEQFSSGPGLQCMTPATSSSGLVSNPVSQQPCIPPNRDNWDLLFQPMFDKYFTPPSNDVSQAEAINTACYTQNRPLIRLRYNKTPYELMQDKKPDLSFFYVFGTLCYPTNDNEDLGLVSNPVSQRPCIPPKRDDWDHLFQPMFDEYFNPPSIVVTPIQEAAAPKAVVLTDSLVSTSIDQDVPSTQKQELSPNISQAITKELQPAMTEPSWIDAMQEEIHEFERLQVWELVSCPDKVLLIKLKWIYKVKTDEFGGVLKNKARLVTQGFRQEEGINFEESFAPVARIEAIHIFVVNAAHKNMTIYQMTQTASLYASSKIGLRSCKPEGFVDQDNPSHVYKLKKALYGLKQAPHAWYDMLSSFLILQYFYKGAVNLILFTQQAGNDLLLGKPIDATLYRGMVGSLIYLTSSRPDLIYTVCLCARMSMTAYADAHYAGCQDTRRGTSGSAQFLGDKLVSWSSKKQKCTAISSTEAEYIALFGVIDLCCNTVQHSRAKHIDVRYHFIKEQVENGIVELYFVRTEYQLADIFTKPLPRQRFNFLIEKLGIRSMTPETLKRLTEETDE
ncbi:retrovirus-related pol polyprotein from transposon TNT 1-94, partial [Tanacetum coccineum]